MSQVEMAHIIHRTPYRVYNNTLPNIHHTPYTIHHAPYSIRITLYDTHHTRRDIPNENGVGFLIDPHPLYEEQQALQLLAHGEVVHQFQLQVRLVSALVLDNELGYVYMY
ncbi:hypothetical protein EON63_13700 [archaeon]|nr:MAG: hypothetical protein EON63_13700 [archaeon]